jgi:hypothetical protein
VKRSSRGTSGRRLAQVVQRRAGLPRDLEDVAESLRRQQRRSRAAPFEQGVRRDRRSVREGGDRTGVGADNRERRHHAGRLVGGRRGDLGEPQLPIGQDDEIRERPTDVDPDPHGVTLP